MWFALLGSKAIAGKWGLELIGGRVLMVSDTFQISSSSFFLCCRCCKILRLTPHGETDSADPVTRFREGVRYAPNHRSYKCRTRPPQVAPVPPCELSRVLEEVGLPFPPVFEYSHHSVYGLSFSLITPDIFNYQLIL